MILATFNKQPAELKDYDVDYSTWLSQISDTIDNVEASVACLTNPLDTSLVVDRLQNTSLLVKLWMIGGLSGQKYKVTITVSTVGGRIDESELIFKVKDF